MKSALMDSAGSAVSTTAAVAAPRRRGRTSGRRFSSTDLAIRLRERIQQGEWKAGDRIPSGSDLIREFDVCQNTLGRALRQLQREGHIVSFQGKGRFVRRAETRRSTRTIGVLVPDGVPGLTHPITRARLDGIQAALLQHRYFIKLAVLPERDGGALEQWAFDPLSVDAVIDFGSDPAFGRALKEHIRVPFCKFAHTVQEDHYLNVRHDYLGGTFRAVKHLLDLGHRRLAFITRHERVGLTRLQCEGAALAVEAARPGFTAEYRVFETDDYDPDQGGRAIRRIFDTGYRPTGVVCGADEYVPSAWAALTDAGLSVPRDVSLVGFNDVLAPEETPAPMTSIRLDYRASGEMAGALVVRHVENPEEEAWESPLVAAELMVRATTAPPRA